MNKRRYEVIAIILAIVIGVSAGWLMKDSAATKELNSVVAQHKKELQESSVKAQHKIEERNKVVDSLAQAHKADSILITNLTNKITQSKITLAETRNAASKLNKDEKTLWLVTRYSADTTTIK